VESIKDFIEESSHFLRFCFIILFAPLGAILYYILRPFKNKIFPGLHSFDNLWISAIYGMITVFIVGLICINLGLFVVGIVCIGTVFIALATHIVYGFLLEKQ
jgi:hypothetical protein